MNPIRPDLSRPVFVPQTGVDSGVPVDRQSAGTAPGAGPTRAAAPASASVDLPGSDLRSIAARIADAERSAFAALGRVDVLEDLDRELVDDAWKGGDFGTVVERASSAGVVVDGVSDLRTLREAVSARLAEERSARAVIGAEITRLTEQMRAVTGAPAISGQQAAQLLRGALLNAPPPTVPPPSSITPSRPLDLLGGAEQG